MRHSAVRRRGIARTPRRRSWWCPSIACIQEPRSDVDRSRVELGVKVAWHAITQQDFHGPRHVCHPCRYSWAIQPLTGMRLWESNDPRRGRTSREAISALRHADRRRHPLTTGTDGALGREIVSRASGGAQQACARCTYFIHAIEGHHLNFPIFGNLRQSPKLSDCCQAARRCPSLPRSRDDL